MLRIQVGDPTERQPAQARGLKPLQHRVQHHRASVLPVCKAFQRLLLQILVSAETQFPPCHLVPTADASPLTITKSSKSWNHRIAEAGKDLQDHEVQTPPSSTTMFITNTLSDHSQG